MSENTLKAKILQLAGPAVGAQNLEIWGLEVIEAGRMLVRLYVDTPGRAEEEAPAETEDGDIPENISATVDQCESISRQLALALDAEEVIDRPYTLEVSTPGLDRLFFSADQMKDYTGEIIDARYPEAITPGDPVKPHRVWRGTLLEAGGDSFVLQPGSVSEDGTFLPEDCPPVTLPFSSARRVRRVYIYARPQNPGRGSRPGKAKKNSSSKAQKGKNS